MKKLMTALVVCAVAGFAIASDVVSENIVGYNQVTLKNGYNLLAVNFGTVGGGAGLTLQELFPTKTNGVPVVGLTGGATQAGSDNIQFYDPTSGYTFYFLYKGVKTSDTKNYKWVASAGGAVADNTNVPSGSAFWYKLVTNITVKATVAGEAVNDVSATKLIKTGYNTFTSVYPIEWNPNDFGTNYWATCGAVPGSTQAGSDNIQFYDPSAGYTFYFLYKGVKTSDTKNYKWVAAAGGAVVNTNILIPGKGAWYKHAGAGFTFTQAKPY